jgi:hypothetical protein
VFDYAPLHHRSCAEVEQLALVSVYVKHGVGQW